MTGRHGNTVVYFYELGCPECCKCELNLRGTFLKKKASCLLLTCKNGGYSKEFYTSVSNDNSFEINVRTVYSMRACGQAYAGLEKLTSLMNLPKPMTANNYGKIVNRLNVVAKEVANEIIRDASEYLLSKSKDTNDDTFIDTAVSCDGSWQKRVYSSLNGVILIYNGKILDIEPMTRTCKSSLLHEKLKNSDSKRFEEWKLKHVYKINHIGTAINMDPEGAKRIWERSIRKNKLRYTEFYGDGDRKGFLAVKETYKGKKIKKLECVGHAQKRMGCRLRNFKKNIKGLSGK